MKILIDTNVFRRFIDSRKQLQKQAVLLQVFEENECIVEYGTLFELAASYKHDSSSFSYLLSIIFRYNMVIATRKGFDADRLCNLIYSGRYLSDLELNEIYDLLLIQTSDAVCNLLAQFFYIFSVLYAYMKCNKASDAFESYLCYVAKETKGFESFKQIAYDYFDNLFRLSYCSKTDDAFSDRFRDALSDNLWNIVCVIESRYSVLSGKNIEYLENIDLDTIFSDALDNFIHLYPQNKCQSIIRRAYRDLEKGNKKFNGVKRIMECIDCSELSPIGWDFMNFYLSKRLLVGHGLFKYNDVIDYFNLQSALELADCVLMFDFKFLKTTAGEFDSISSCEFYRKSIEYSKRVYDRWKT